MNFGCMGGLIQKVIPTLLSCVMVYNVGHTIMHQRLSHTISMPTIGNVPSTSYLSAPHPLPRVITKFSKDRFMMAKNISSKLLALP